MGASGRGSRPGQPLRPLSLTLLSSVWRSASSRVRSESCTTADASTSATLASTSEVMRASVSSSISLAS